MFPDMMADQAAAYFDNPAAESWSQILRREGWNNPTLPKTTVAWADRL